MKLTANELLKIEIIDEIIKEPTGGAHRNREEMVLSSKAMITKYLDEFKNYSREEIFEKRKEKFLNIGKQKAFTVFSSSAKWIGQDNFLAFFKKNLFKFKKEILIISILILLSALFLL